MKQLLLLLLPAAVFVRGQLVTPSWVELGEGGRAMARVVAASAENCPAIEIDGISRPMILRRPVPAGFLPACEFSLPAGAKSARVNGQALNVPRPDPSRVVVIGDTGCRVKGDRLQACNDPAKWPFEAVAEAAVPARANVMIHVGDYLYREDPCPASARAQCGGTPSGDNWNAWNADFFKPVAKLLGAAPWVFVRGNHESCQRAWRGFFYYLDPHDWAGGACQSTPPTYTVELGKFQLVVFDSSSVGEAQVEPGQRNEYAAELASLRPSHAWLVDHHPFFGIRPGAAGQPPAVENLTLEDAWNRAAPKGVDMILSGHTHLFEALSYGTVRPVQIVAGVGGTNLDTPVPEKVNGMNVEGVMVAASENQDQFGYVLFKRAGVAWNLELKGLENQTVAACHFVFDAGRERQAVCKSSPIQNARHE